MRFVVKRNLGSQGSPGVDFAAVAPGVEIIDRIDDEAALIEATEEEAERLQAALPDWSVHPERNIAPPVPPFPRDAWKRDRS